MYGAGGPFPLIPFRYGPKHLRALGPLTRTPGSVTMASAHPLCYPHPPVCEPRFLWGAPTAEDHLPVRLIVNADDYGRTAGVAKGILLAHREGIVTSTTAMMNMPEIETALRWARDEPLLGLGVHLVFTAWKPLLPAHRVPSLVDETGQFYRAEAWHARLERLEMKELWAEWEAQLALFHQVAGQPDHIDCHHFVHLYPPVFETYLRFAREKGLPARIPFPLSDSRGDDATGLGMSLGLASQVVAAALQADRELVRAIPVRHPDHFRGGFFGDQNLTLEHLLSILADLPDGLAELMVHPGLADGELLNTSGYARQRERELEILCNPLLKRRLVEWGIELVNYGVLQ